MDMLRNCPRSLTQLSEPAFPSLSRACINPLSKNAPYPPVIGEAILEGIDKCDKSLLDKYLRDLGREEGREEIRMDLVMTRTHQNL